MVDSETTPEPPSKEELRLAMKAFRKRLKLTRLDDESRMGYGATSSGQESGPPQSVSQNRLAGTGKTGKTQTRPRWTLFTR